MTPDSIRSRSTWPGPTDASWSTSPTHVRTDPFLMAWMKECVSLTSIMENSSRMNASSGNGSFALNEKPPSEAWNWSRR